MSMQFVGVAVLATFSNLFSFRIKCIFNFGKWNILQHSACAYFDCHLPLVSLRPERQLQRGANTMLSISNADPTCTCNTRVFFSTFPLDSIGTWYTQLSRPDLCCSPLHRFFAVCLYLIFRHRSHLHLSKIITKFKTVWNLETNFWFHFKILLLFPHVYLSTNSCSTLETR